MKAPSVRVTNITQRIWEFSEEEIEAALRLAHNLPSGAEFSWRDGYCVACTVVCKDVSAEERTDFSDQLKKG